MELGDSRLQRQTLCLLTFDQQWTTRRREEKERVNPSSIVGTIRVSKYDVRCDELREGERGVGYEDENLLF